MPPKKPVKKAISSSRPVATSTKPRAGIAKGPVRKPPQQLKKGPAAKTSTTGKGKAPDSTKKPAEAKKSKPPSKEDLAAIVIQKWIRRFLGRCRLVRLRKEKEDYEEMMEKLEREAFLAVVKREQEAFEKERQKEEEERRKRRQHLKRQKRILEAAFDGDDDEIRTVLKEVDAQDNKDDVSRSETGMILHAKHQLEMVNCEDPNSNTALSEAASGGNASTLKLLIERGADVNAQGQFKRTPLYRAAFAGHLEAVQVLLQSGADPRLYASDGATPEQVASIDAIKQVFASWDISVTDSMLEMIETTRQQRIEEERRRREEEMTNLENQLKEAEKDYQSRQRQLTKAYEELNKRIYEHDKCMGTGHKTDITLQAVHEAEHDLEMIKMEGERSREQLSAIRLAMREKEKEGAGAEEMVGVKCNIKELDDVLMRDVGDKIKSDGRWPLLIDPSGRATMFLRYRDTNLLNALNPTQMQPEAIRMAILGAIRFGKPLVLDMLDVDMYPCTTRFDEVHKGLMEDIITKEILQDHRYEYLIKESDGADYSKNQFNDLRIEGFKFVIISKIEPSALMLEKTYPIRIVVG